jgi:hypothetical protein
MAGRLQLVAIALASTWCRQLVNAIELARPARCRHRRPGSHLPWESNAVRAGAGMAMAGRLQLVAIAPAARRRRTGQDLAKSRSLAHPEIAPE